MIIKISTHPCKPRNFVLFSCGWSKKIFFLISRLPTKKNWDFQNRQFSIFLWRFQRLVLGFVKLIQVKDIDVAQSTVWSVNDGLSRNLPQTSAENFHMKISQSFLVSKDGSKFWWFPWFPAVFYPGQTLCSRVYVCANCFLNVVWFCMKILMIIYNGWVIYNTRLWRQNWKYVVIWGLAAFDKDY